MSKNIYLTKSRFKTGTQCPTKLYYLDRPECENKNKENSFLEALADGGVAMTAYSRMQFSEMTKLESDRIVSALLKYCKLDTFAMVMIIEYW